MEEEKNGLLFVKGISIPFFILITGGGNGDVE